MQHISSRSAQVACLAILLCITSIGQVYAGAGTLSNDGTLDLRINFRFPPSTALINDIKKSVTGADRLLCDATDGQVTMGTVTLDSGSVGEDQADIWVVLETGRSTGGATIVTDDDGKAVDVLRGLTTQGAHIVWKPEKKDDFFSEFRSRTLAHELGHYIFALGEQYDEQSRPPDPFIGENCGIGPGFGLAFSDNSVVFDASNNSLMGSGITRCGDTDGVICSLDSDCDNGVTCVDIGSNPVANGNVSKVIGGYSEFSVPQNHDLRRGNNMGCKPGCAPAAGVDCGDNWNTSTGRFEQAHQESVHHESDWETITRLYPFLTMPAGLPNPDPGFCATIEPVFNDSTSGKTDHVVLLTDRSWSMASSISKSIVEVCDNGRDDDEDGTTDEDNCAQSRLDFAKAAARVFVDINKDRNINLGIAAFNQNATVRKSMQVLSAANANSFKSTIDSITANGNTAIGEGINVASDLLEEVAEAGKTQTILLLSDGHNNSGADPEQANMEFKSAIENAGGLARTFTIPVSSSADEELLARLAADPAKMIQAPTGDELTGIYAELAALHRGESLVLPRTNGVAGQGKSQSYSIQVEKGAKQLTIVIAGRNARMANWNVDYSILPPGSTVSFQPNCKSLSDPYYCLIQRPNPNPGTWILIISSQSTDNQEYVVLASIDNPDPDCFADVVPRIQQHNQPTLILAAPYFKMPLEGNITIDGTVRRPTGSSVPITIPHFTNYTAVAVPFNQYTSRGIYEVNLKCTVPPGTLPEKGESIFDGPERSDIEVQPFVRYVTTSFFRDSVTFPPCISSVDCDGDGIRDTVDRCDVDTDKDGIPDCHDTDSDNDEHSDTIEGMVDSDRDGIPDFQDPDSDNDTILDAKEGSADPDKDGIPNRIDLDSDNDGIDDRVDNCPYVANKNQNDADGDNIGDACDNCIKVSNPNQRDINEDGYGNACDGDLNDDGIVDTRDLGLFKQAFRKKGAHLSADFNGDGIVNVKDFMRFKSMFGAVPGPAARSSK